MGIVRHLRRWRPRRQGGLGREQIDPYAISLATGEAPIEPLRPGWWARLQGETTDLDALLTTVAARGLEIVRHRDQYYLRSDDFEGLEASQAVERRAEEVVRVLNGAAQVHFGDHRQVTVDAVVSATECGGIDAFVHLSALVHARSRVRATLSVGGAKAVQPTATDIQQFTLAGLADEDAERALRIFGRDDLDWRDLYFVFEIVQASAGGRMFEGGWASHAEVDRFKHTANSPAALADQARHGHQRQQPPENPMEFQDARELVRRLLGAWLPTVGGAP